MPPRFRRPRLRTIDPDDATPTATGGGLRRSAVRGGSSLAVAQVLGQIVQFVGVAVLARLIDPTDFGLVGMVAAVLGYLNLFSDAGLSQATVQRDRINHAQVSTLFWANGLLSLLLGGLAAALAPVIAWFYNEPQLVAVTLALSTSFAFRGFSAQHRALLSRNLLFHRLALIPLLAGSTGLALAITAAALGAGLWALVIQQVAAAALTSLLAWAFFPWLPGLPRRRAGTRSLFAFGGLFTLSNSMNYLFYNLDNVLIGWYWGPAALGLYTRAYALLLVPMKQIVGPLNGVALPTLSKLQHDPDRFRTALQTGVSLLALAALPLSVFLLVATHDFVLTVLGPKWIAAVSIFRALGPAAILLTLTPAVGWVFVALGRMKQLTLWTLVTGPLAIAGFFIALPHSPTAVGLSLSITALTVYYPMHVYALRGLPITPLQMLTPAWRPAAASALAAAVTAAPLAFNTLPGVSAPVRLACLAAVFAVTFAAAWFLFPGGRAALQDITNLFRNRRPRPQPA